MWCQVTALSGFQFCFSFTLFTTTRGRHGDTDQTRPGRLECKLRLNKQLYILHFRTYKIKILCLQKSVICDNIFEEKNLCGVLEIFDNPGSNFKTLGCQNFSSKTKFNPLAFSNTAL